MNKIEKKDKKEFQGICENVKENFSPRGLSKDFIHSIAKSVKVNKTLLEKDKKVIEEWYENFYHQELFSKFKKLIDEHNEKIKFNVDDMSNRIRELQTIIVKKERELKKLKRKIKKNKRK